MLILGHVEAHHMLIATVRAWSFCNICVCVCACVCTLRLYNQLFVSEMLCG